MLKSEHIKQEELPPSVEHFLASQQLGMPIKDLMMESTVRYNFKWFLVMGTVLAFIPIGLALSSRTPFSLTLVGLYLVLVAGSWLYYFSVPFKRYGQQHALHIYLCSNGIVGTRNGSIVYSYPWSQVKAVILNNYHKAGSECKLQLVDGRQIPIKTTKQPVPKGLWDTDALVRVIEDALSYYRSHQ